jgi:PII-like signaling protein
MHGLVDDVVAITPRGLITLERARRAMHAHDAVKLTVYVGRHQRVSGRPAFIATCDLLYREGVAGASVFLGVDGTAHGQRRRARFFSPNVDVPVMITSVGDRADVERVVPQLNSLLPDPLVTVERIRVCKRDGQLLARPDRLPETDSHGRPLWQKLMVYTSESALHHGQPIHRALVRRLRGSAAASGATVLRGIWGFHGPRKPHGDKLFQLSRQVPVTTIIVDTPARIAHSFDIVDELTHDHGLVTSEMVPALIVIDGDERFGATDLADYRY